MESLARFVLTVTELFEAIGRELERQLVHCIIAAGIGLSILGFIVAGPGFFLFSLFIAVAATLTPTSAALSLRIVAKLPPEATIEMFREPSLTSAPI